MKKSCEVVNGCSFVTLRNALRNGTAGRDGGEQGPLHDETDVIAKTFPFLMISYHFRTPCRSVIMEKKCRVHANAKFARNQLSEGKPLSLF
jgi:hypothetical protein